MRWVVKAMPRQLFLQQRDPVHTVQEAGRGRGATPVWTDAKNLVLHQDSITRPSSLQQVAIPTTLSRQLPLLYEILKQSQYNYFLL